MDAGLCQAEGGEEDTLSRFLRRVIEGVGRADVHPSSCPVRRCLMRRPRSTWLLLFTFFLAAAFLCPEVKAQPPKQKEEEKATRAAAIQDALKIAAGTPLEIMKNALDVLALTEILAEKGNPNAITDLGCAVHLANAAIAGAELNVRINLGSIADHEFTKRIGVEIAQIQRVAKELSQEVLTIVESKI